MLYLAVALLIVGIILLWQVQKQQYTIGMPTGRVIYSDTGKWGAVERPLYDPELDLTGKPDYLVEEVDHLGVLREVIPVEVKSGRISTAPYDSHIYQLAAYCLLTHRQFGKRPAYGVLHYSNRTFAIDYTPSLEASLLGLLEQMRTLERRREIRRSHDSAARCTHCGYHSACDQKLM